MPQTTIKGQVLADFVVEFTEGVPKEENAVMGVLVSSTIVAPSWKVYMDGASNRKGAGVGIVLVTPKKLIMEKSLRLGFSATNNEAEYEALLARIAMVKLLGGDTVELYSDSKLIVGQVDGDFETQDERMQGYLAKVYNARAQFKGFILKQIPREQNSHVDSLAMLATSLESSLPRVVIEEIDTSSLIGASLIGVCSLYVGPSWIDPIVTFLKQGSLPEDKCEVEKIRRAAPRY